MNDHEQNSPNDQMGQPVWKPTSAVWYGRTVLAGLALVFPFAVIVGLLHYVYILVNDYFIDPVGKIVLESGYSNEFIDVWAPLISVVAVIALLFFCGLLFRTRVRNLIDWMMGRIPGVSTIYYALRDTGRALQGPPGIESVDTVVLVPFPHQSARMAGYLMSKMNETDGDRKILCVYIPLVLFPPSGYTLMIPESEVIYTDWEAKEVWKLLLSGGLTLPESVPFDPDHQRSSSAA